MSLNVLCSSLPLHMLASPALPLLWSSLTPLIPGVCSLGGPSSNLLLDWVFHTSEPSHQIGNNPNSYLMDVFPVHYMIWDVCPFLHCVSSGQMVGHIASRKNPVSNSLLVLHCCCNKSPRIVGRIQFLVFVGLRSPFSCQLPGEHCSLLLKATHIPCIPLPLPA